MPLESQEDDQELQALCSKVSMKFIFGLCLNLHAICLTLANLSVDSTIRKRSENDTWICDKDSSASFILKEITKGFPL